LMRPGQPVLLALLFLSLVTVSCGKKAAPFLPSKEPSNRVTDLGGVWNGKDLLITGRVQEPLEAKEGDGCRIYYSVYPLDQPPCEGCPIEYQGYQPFGREALRGDGFSFIVPGIQRGNVYFFEARIVGPDGSSGLPSNTVRVEVPYNQESNPITKARKEECGN
jgi:hypothetical protein